MLRGCGPAEGTGRGSARRHRRVRCSQCVRSVGVGIGLLGRCHPQHPILSQRWNGRRTQSNSPVHSEQLWAWNQPTTLYGLDPPEVSNSGAVLPAWTHSPAGRWRSCGTICSAVTSCSPSWPGNSKLVSMVSRSSTSPSSAIFTVPTKRNESAGYRMICEPGASMPWYPGWVVEAAVRPP